jgi:deazaflavin-dependent oxidoreductase (nitroreductase family)
MTATPYNEKTIAEFHAKQGLGVGPFGDHVLLMTAKGARSGRSITTPLVYGRNGNDYVVVASKGGAPQNPTWFTNIQVNPDVEVEVASEGGVEKFEAKAHVVEHRAERDRIFQEMAKIWPAYLEYQQRTERVIPVVILEREQ